MECTLIEIILIGQDSGVARRALFSRCRRHRRNDGRASEPAAHLLLDLPHG